jgi:hypothetical protein
LHYRFNIANIFLALFTIGLLSILSTVLWVLFGVPGQGAGQTQRLTQYGAVGWEKDAEVRVLTGLVLGGFVGVLGGVGVGAWCLGGWILL